MQKSKPKYACLPSKIVEVWIERFCVRYDWWRRLQPTSSVSPVCIWFLQMFCCIWKFSLTNSIFRKKNVFWKIFEIIFENKFQKKNFWKKFFFLKFFFRQRFFWKKKFSQKIFLSKEFFFQFFWICSWCVKCLIWFRFWMSFQLFHLFHNAHTISQDCDLTFHFISNFKFHAWTQRTKADGSAGSAKTVFHRNFVEFSI